LTKTDDNPRGDEIFLHCSTIAGACSRLFRICFLKPETIPITPEGGYEKNDRQSRVANKYLRYTKFFIFILKIDGTMNNWATTWKMFTLHKVKRGNIKCP